MIDAMRHIILNTTTGPFALVESKDGSLHSGWVDQSMRALLQQSTQDTSLMPDLVSRLNDYFLGESVDFSDVPLPAGTAFQRACWKRCRRIKRGTTISYSDLAAAAGSPGAARAAGQAMRRNPLPIIIPCHRVVGSDGRLNGFAGSDDSKGRELQTKARLLQMEGALADLHSLP